jgi:hypothetical protein
MDWELVQVGDGGTADGTAVVTDFIQFTELDPAVAGRVRLVQEPPANGAMGAVAVGAKIVGVAARVVASVAVAWLSAYHSDVTIRLTAGDGRSIEVSGARVRRMSADEIVPMVAQVAAVLDGGSIAGAQHIQVATAGGQAAEIAAAPGAGAAQAAPEEGVSAPMSAGDSAGPAVPV